MERKKVNKPLWDMNIILKKNHMNIIILRVWIMGLDNQILITEDELYEHFLITKLF